MASTKVVVDVLEQCATMGELHHALIRGYVGKGDVHAELGEVVDGQKPGRESEEEVIIFDSTGTALQDAGRCRGGLPEGAQGGAWAPCESFAARFLTLADSLALGRPPA